MLSLKQRVFSQIEPLEKRSLAEAIELEGHGNHDTPHIQYYDRKNE